MLLRLAFWMLSLGVAILSLACPAAGPGRNQIPEPPTEPLHLSVVPSEPSEMTFDDAATSLLASLQEAAPEGVTVKMRESTPLALGWRTSEGTPAKIVELWASSGVNTTYGLLPHQGRYSHAGNLQVMGPEEMGGTPQLIAMGPDLVVVGAPSPQVALTLDVERRDWPLLEKAASTTVNLWREGETLSPQAHPAGLQAATRVVRHPHWLEVELPAGLEIDPAVVFSTEVRALSYREAPPIRGGLLPVPTLVIAEP